MNNPTPPVHPVLQNLLATTPMVSAHKAHNAAAALVDTYADALRDSTQRERMYQGHIDLMAHQAATTERGLKGRIEELERVVKQLQDRNTSLTEEIQRLVPAAPKPIPVGGSVMAAQPGEKFFVAEEP